MFFFAKEHTVITIVVTMSPGLVCVDVPIDTNHAPFTDTVPTPVSTQILVESEVPTLPTIFAFGSQRSLTSEDTKNYGNPSAHSIEQKASNSLVTE